MLIVRHYAFSFCIKLETLSINLNRLNHLMELLRVTKEDLLGKLNEKRKKILVEKDVFISEMPASLLKKIDAIFNKGLAYYLDPKDPVKSSDESIFFRKDDFNAVLSLGAKQIVNKFEEDKLSFAALSKLIDFPIKRTVPVYTISDNPVAVASEVRGYLYPVFDNNKRTFLSNFIASLAEYNILVFEFVEAHNKKERANINGFFLSPNVIVLKRNQKSFRREIFTLAHELGHYLLNAEDIDDNLSDNFFVNNKSNSNNIEDWCNNFAFAFLVGSYGKELDELSRATASNDYHHSIIDAIAQSTHLSTLALYTRLLINGKLSPVDYTAIADNIMEEFKKSELAKKEALEKAKKKALDEGKTLIIPAPKPIISPLYLQTLQGALYNGLINEQDFCKRLHIPADKLDSYLV